jgi:hypothetical protein
MKNYTITLTVPASREVVFGFLSKAKTLPEWATEYCLSLKRDGHHWKITPPNSDHVFMISANELTGLIDMQSGPALDQVCTFPIF